MSGFFRVPDAVSIQLSVRVRVGMPAERPVVFCLPECGRLNSSFYCLLIYRYPAVFLPQTGILYA